MEGKTQEDAVNELFNKVDDCITTYNTAAGVKTAARGAMWSKMKRLADVTADERGPTIARPPEAPRIQPPRGMTMPWPGTMSWQPKMV